jgi:hypothetical protein
MTIVGILSAVVIPRLDVSTTPRASVEGAAVMIASDIRYAQEFAMAHRISKSVIFIAGSDGYTFNPANNLDPSGRLPSGVMIKNTVTITFNSLGEPTMGGGETISISRGGQTKAISIVEDTGKVNIS